MNENYFSDQTPSEPVNVIPWFAIGCIAMLIGLIAVSLFGYRYFVRTFDSMHRRRAMLLEELKWDAAIVRQKGASDPAYQRILHIASEAPTPFDRAIVINIIGGLAADGHHTPEGIQVLGDALLSRLPHGRPDSMCRSSACNAFSRCGELARPFIPRLIENAHLKDVESCSLGAILVLEQFDDPEVIETLQKIAADERHVACEYAIRGLQHIRKRTRQPLEIPNEESLGPARAPQPRRRVSDLPHTGIWVDQREPATPI